MKMRTFPAPLRLLLISSAALSLFIADARGEDAAKLELRPGDHVVLIGNTLAEEMQEFGHFETLLYQRFPQHKLVVRNLAWSADELALRPRSTGFGSPDTHLTRQKADVILSFFGFNESFAGPRGLPNFEKQLADLIDHMRQQRYNGKSGPRLAFFSPIAFENLGNRNLPDGAEQNSNLKLYTSAMARVCRQKNVPFVDLFAPTLAIMKASQQKLTFNGIHLTDDGYRRLAPLLDEALFGPQPQSASAVNYETLRAAVNEKSRQFEFRYRTVNGCYIYGERARPFGVVSFPPEMKKLDQMVDNRDRRIWSIAQGQSVPATIDDSNTLVLKPAQTNFEQPIHLLTPEQSLKKFELAKGYQINLFASEVQFPDLSNPLQMAFDARGRMWVCTMPTYPQYLPGVPPNDKILILEDTRGDGRAHKETVFADGLHIPTGFELGDGGVYVAQVPNLVFLKDTNGDDKADFKQTVLHGFDSADAHHAINAFTWGPGGGLYFEEGVFYHSQIESPYGPLRLANAGVYRYEPRTARISAFVSYGFANPWGHVFDHWGQDFIADASGGANYFAAPFSGHVEYPTKHPRMKEFLERQWRPTTGCEIVSSRQFRDEDQGHYLLANVIGFLGVLQYKFKDQGSGFHADPVAPLLKSSDPNFRPIDIKFGPDGALYVVDWYNPLIGHMQHSLRDPNRDHTHGRIWRITAKDRPLVKPPKIAGEPIPVLLDLLKTYEDRTRYTVRRELRERNTTEVTAALKKWVAGLDPQDPDYQHHLLEALWVYQGHNVVNEALLKQLLRSPDYRVRAAATRVLSFWGDRVNNALELVKVQAGDVHPRVRLEAVRAASFFQGYAAAEAALEALNHPQDDYLKYTMQETMNTLDKYLKEGTAGN